MDPERAQRQDIYIIFVWLIHSLLLLPWVDALIAILQTQTKFTAPAGDDPVAIDFTGLGKGEAWVNGQSIGRYWPTNIAPQSGCVNSCNYRGSYTSSKCLKKCGQPSQTL